MKNKSFTLKFILILIITMFPIIFFPIYSKYYTSIFHMPKIEGATLDLNDYDFMTRRSLPLNGDWEYFSNKWIVTDRQQDAAADDYVDIPDIGMDNPLLDSLKQDTVKESYRLYLKNCPGDIPLVASIPYIYSYYRVFLNGQLVAQKGDMIHTTSEKPLYDKNIALTQPPSFNGIILSDGSDAELIIETKKIRGTSIYMVPVLSEETRNHNTMNERNLIAAILVGGLIVIICAMGYILVKKDNSLLLFSLFIMNVIAFIRVLFKNEYFSPFKGTTYFDNFTLNIFIQILSSFLPIAFLYFCNQFYKNQVNKKTILLIAVYELTLSPLVFLSAFSGQFFLQYLLCTASYIPFIIPIKNIYEGGKKGVPHSLTIIAILMLTLSSMLSATLCYSGLVINDVTLYPTVCFFLAVVLQLVLYLNKNFELQRQALEAAKLKIRLKESRMELMLSQIQPHFLNNTLIAIHMLCTENPELAAETVLKFATYFRSNMNFINCTSPIPFEKELQHIKNYADIEKLRFQKRLDMNYDIHTTDFNVPPLSIQPLIENAIRWGACKNISGGTVSLKTYETIQHHIIEISDNGPGFDTSQLCQSSQEPHGIQNVSFRLKEYLNATIQINSILDEGTTIYVYIPKENEREHNISR